MIVAFVELGVWWDPSSVSHIQASSGSDSPWGGGGGGGGHGGQRTYKGCRFGGQIDPSSNFGPATY